MIVFADYAYADAAVDDEAENEGYSDIEVNDNEAGDHVY